jgi:DHA3 family macrolide efflux protein-like MFS transporter
LVVVGNIAAVGQVFIIAMLTTIFCSPVTAVIVDRYNRKYLVIIAHLGIATSLLALGFAIASIENISLIWFFLTVFSVTIFRNLYQSSHDGLIHANVDKQRFVTVVARFRGLHLVATAASTVLTGVIIERYSNTTGFIFSALSSTILFISVIFVNGVVSHEKIVGVSGFIADFREGLSLFKNNLILQNLTLLAGIALPVGQLSNAILSSFIHDDLGRSSDIFGLVDAAWPVGGILAVAFVGIGIKRLDGVNVEYLIASLAGISTILFSFCSAILPLAVLHAARGFTVWLCRIIIDGRILQTCDTRSVGRTKVYIEMMFSFVAMLMCFSPTFIKLPTTSNYFLYWGLFIATSALLLWLRQLFQRDDKTTC